MWDTQEFSQFAKTVTCRKKNLSSSEGWIRMNIKIGPMLETEKNVEWKIGIESLHRDNSHSCNRISHYMNKLITDLSTNKKDDNNEQETFEMQFEDFCVENECTCFSEPIKGWSKITKTYFCKELRLMLSQKIIILQSLTQCQNNWLLFFVMVIYLEKTMTRLRSR